MPDSNAVTILGVIQARMGSKRLPGKMAMEICGQPLIELIINRAKQITCIRQLIVATTKDPADDFIMKIAERCKVDIYRGSIDNVASRYIDCVHNFGCDYFLRLNGDSPCLDPALIDEGAVFCTGGSDLISNLPSRTYPYGISLEIVKSETFTNCFPLMDSYEREHITSYFYRNANKFRIKEVLNPDVKDNPAFNFTIDTPEDLERVSGFLGDNPYRSWREAR